MIDSLLSIPEDEFILASSGGLKWYAEAVMNAQVDSSLQFAYCIAGGTSINRPPKALCFQIIFLSTKIA